jgi:hypothetical protein
MDPVPGSELVGVPVHDEAKFAREDQPELLAEMSEGALVPFQISNFTDGREG